MMAQELQVSIHAPTRGATLRLLSVYVQPLFQSTHPRGVRPCGYHVVFLTLCFNPRTHEGCDGFNINANETLKFQSTHPRGVRLFAACEIGALEWFQSTHPRGVRHTHTTTPEPTDPFQSTHPRGVRPIVAFSLHSETYVSIHAPTRGATDRQRKPLKH